VAPVASGWSISPGGTRTHWKAPPFHGAPAKRTLSRLWVALTRETSIPAQSPETAAQSERDPAGNRSSAGAFQNRAGVRLFGVPRLLWGCSPIERRSERIDTSRRHPRSLGASRALLRRLHAAPACRRSPHASVTGKKYGHGGAAHVAAPTTPTKLR